MLLKSNPNNNLYSDFDYQRMHLEDNNRKGRRDEFERDYGRIIHSSAFRRLQGKTQVFGPSEGDFHRTRLTHTLEVAQIARGIAIHLNETSEYLKESNAQLDVSLIEAAALAHDLGHPPFGHQGERALNKGMQNFNLGFEGNAHTFRLLTYLEGNKKIGLNLSRATLLAICKYPVVFDKAFNALAPNEKPPKSNIFPEDIHTWNWLLEIFSNSESHYYLELIESPFKHRSTKNKSLECSIVELADDIAYATHDLQDVLKYKLLQLDDLKDLINTIVNPTKYKETVEQINRLKLSQSDFDFKLKEIIANLISTLIQDITLKTTDKTFSSSRLKYKATIGPESEKVMRILNNELIYNKVILSQRLQTLEWKGGFIVEKLFETLMNDTRLLPNDKQKLLSNNDSLKARVVCDYIAGMTDKYAENFYKRLFEPNGGRLFDL